MCGNKKLVFIYATGHLIGLNGIGQLQKLTPKHQRYQCLQNILSEDISTSQVILLTSVFSSSSFDFLGESATRPLSSNSAWVVNQYTPQKSMKLDTNFSNSLRVF